MHASGAQQGIAGAPGRIPRRARRRVRAAGLLAAAALASAADGPVRADDDPAPPAAAPVSAGEAVPPYASATNLLLKLNWLHDWTHRVAQRGAERADGWFIPDGQPPRQVPSVHLRLGLYGQADVGTGDEFTLSPMVDSEASVRLPNAEHRLKLFITTMDPTKLPGTDLTEERSELRVGAVRSWMRDVDTSVGVKVRWLPVLYTRATWGPEYRSGTWRLLPAQKVYWESDDGVGEVSSFLADRMKNRWDARWVSAVKWSRSKQKDDENADTGDAGWEWEQTVMGGYVWELLEERDTDRLIGASDLARGAGARFSLFGGPDSVGTVRLTLFYRSRLYSHWIYYSLAPEAEWSRDTGWDRDLRLKVGLDLLCWGRHER